MGAVVLELKEVAKLFHAFFYKLYSLPTLSANPQDRQRMLGNFLSTCGLLKLGKVAPDHFNAPITK